MAHTINGSRVTTPESHRGQQKISLFAVGGMVSAAKIIFDDSLTNIETLTQATINAGFPSTLEP